jgi:hypothetical protein
MTHRRERLPRIAQARRLAATASLVALAASGAFADPPQAAAADSTPRIVATPNPVPADARTTSIRWSTGSADVGNVTVAVDFGEERLFASGPSGEGVADWIVRGRRYEFVLRGPTGEKLASVLVTRERGSRGGHSNAALVAGLGVVLLLGGLLVGARVKGPSPPPPASGGVGWLVGAALVAASVAACIPLFDGLDRWGRQDWDQFTFRYETPRVALLRDHVAPTWNPYANGGNVLLAHPNSPALSPFYALVLALGAPVGLRVQVMVFMAVGAVGMAALSRLLGANRAGSFVGGIVYATSSHYVLHSTEGHMEWSVLGLMPWLAFCVLRSEAEPRLRLVAALLLASTLTFGAVYIPAVFLPFFTLWFVLLSAQTRRLKTLGAALVVFGLGILLAGGKLLPMSEFTADAPRDVRLDQRTRPGVLLHGLFDPDQALLYRAWRDRHLPEGHPARTVEPGAASRAVALLARIEVDEGFHEYGCYIGLAGWLLAAVGFSRTLRRLWPLYLAGAVALVTASGASAPVDLWAALRQLPFYGQLQVPSRFLSAVVFVLAVAAALGADTLSRGGRGRRAGAGLLALALCVELGSMAWNLLGDVFVVPAAQPRAHERFAQRHRTRFDGPASERSHGLVMQSVMMGRLRSNSGTLDAYENLSVEQGDVLTTQDAGYRGEAYLLGGRGQATIVEWTMSRLRIRVEAEAADELVINQNFHRGWQVRRRTHGGDKQVEEARRSPRGLILVPVRPEDGEIELWYWPPGLGAGLGVSALGLLAWVAIALSGRASSRWLRTPRDSPAAPVR